MVGIIEDGADGDGAIPPWAADWYELGHVVVLVSKTIDLPRDFGRHEHNG